MMRSAIAFCSIVALLVAGVVAVRPAVVSAEPIVMKLGTATLNDTQHEWMRRYKAAVEQDSKGLIEVQLYPSSQLGSIPREIEATQFGQIQGWVGPPEFLVGVDHRYQVLSAPGVFSSWPQATATAFDPQFNAAFLALGADKGLKGVSVWLAGDSALMMRTPVRQLADAKRLKIRIIAGPLQEAEMRTLGASGIAMPLDQVAPALQQGAVDGIITNIAVGTPLRYFDSAPYATAIGQPYLFSVCVISKSWYDALAPDLQKVVIDDGKRVSKTFLPWVIGFDKRQRDGWVAGGGTIIQLSASEQKQFISRLIPLGGDVLKSDAPSLAMYNLLIAARNRVK